MVLHLVATESEPEESEVIRLFSGDKPRIEEWASDPVDQIISHVASGCRFRAVRIEYDTLQAVRPPFGRYEIAVRFVGMVKTRRAPAWEQIKDIGRQGIEWILTHTAEARR